MTEKEKMLAGLDYLTFDEELTRERIAAKKLCHQYNLLEPDDFEQKNILLKELLGTVTDAVIEPNFQCDFGYNIHLGKNFYANHNCVILDCSLVNIGDNVMFGPNVTLSAPGHPLNVEGRVAGLEFSKPITIGNNVWLGASVTVNPGVTIGDNTVIGSGSVVTKDIPANCVAVGVPCRFVKSLPES
ncbi:maltose acetyltransferase [Endozoicomonas montiporae]|uniref:Acetyltransferase n=2 Tax=Endozoicomonas montiporae TaxID=1027273 RepID=A0A081N1F2_9GAMM|nr:sugar O-acetyltransferase [Endozoicomonas montiporae]AMO58798.1 maltose O-acetyltransferase [Endozoicomonas montiporae CL-33]KEQ12275.1 maltose acetyltransferase [Endozoicomonas montiporae]